MKVTFKFYWTAHRNSKDEILKHTCGPYEIRPLYNQFYCIYFEGTLIGTRNLISAAKTCARLHARSLGHKVKRPGRMPK